MGNIGVEVGDAAAHAVPVGQPLRGVADGRLWDAGLMASAMRKVAFSLPCAPNSGHTSTIGMS